MAIKGKKRSRPRSAPRPPKHVPVAAPTPFLRRTWVQIISGFLVGVLVMIVLVWVTNGLRTNDAEAAADTKASKRLAAATAYQQAVRAAYSKVGVVDPGAPPTIFAEMDAALDSLAKGKASTGAAKAFSQAEVDAAAAGKELSAFDVRATIVDQGFDPIAVTAYTNSAESLTTVLDLYGQAARVAVSAVEVGGEQGQRLAKVAVELRNAARSELFEGWTEYLEALRAGGVIETPTTGGLAPGLPGGGG